MSPMGLAYLIFQPHYHGMRSLTLLMMRSAETLGNVRYLFLMPEGTWVSLISTKHATRFGLQSSNIHPAATKCFGFCITSCCSPSHRRTRNVFCALSSASRSASAIF
jgi:hypothetical protein